MLFAIQAISDDQCPAYASVCHLLFFLFSVSAISLCEMACGYTTALHVVARCVQVGGKQVATPRPVFTLAWIISPYVWC